MTDKIDKDFEAAWKLIEADEEFFNYSYKGFALLGWQAAQDAMLKRLPSDKEIFECSQWKEFPEEVGPRSFREGVYWLLAKLKGEK